MALKGNVKAQYVLFVDGIKHDLLSVGQICDANHNITFFSHHCEIRRNGSRRIIGKGTRSPGNVYVLNEIEGNKCYIRQNDNSWLWHKRLAHLNFDYLVKISRTEAVRGMPKLSKPVDRLCGSCFTGNKLELVANLIHISPLHNL